MQQNNNVTEIDIKIVYCT